MSINLAKIKKIYFIGIKGVAMSGLAVICQQKGMKVFGSDVSEKFITDKILSQHQIEVFEEFGDPVISGVRIEKKEDFPEDLRMPAASLMECAGRRVDRAKLLCALLESMEEYYEELKSKGIMSIVQKWRRLCGTLNKRIKVSLPGGIITGIAEDVTQEGGLVVRIGDGSTKVIFAGDVTLLEE